MQSAYHASREYPYITLIETVGWLGELKKILLGSLLPLCLDDTL